LTSKLRKNKGGLGMNTALF